MSGGFFFKRDKVKTYLMIVGMLVVLFVASDVVSAVEITGVTIEAFSSFYAPTNLHPVNMLNGSGLDVNGPGTHSVTAANTMWQSDYGNPLNEWVVFDLGAEYEPNVLRVWNYNESLGDPDFYTLRSGVKDLLVRASATDFTGNWDAMPVVGTYTIDQAPGYDDVAFGTVYNLNPGTAVRYILFDVVSTWDPTGTYPLVGLSEVRFFYTPDPFSPEVNAGADTSCCLTAGSCVVDLDGTVINPPGAPEPVMTLWTVISGPGAVVFGDTSQVDTTATFTVTGSYVLQLEADNTSSIGTDTVSIEVYANACDAAKAEPGYVPIPGDFNEDCYVDLSDFSLMATHWLECTLTEEQVNSPAVQGSWSLIVLPDQQLQTQLWPELNHLQTLWILENKVNYNIKYVMNNGDVTNWNTPWEWERARSAYSRLDGKVPYAIVMGNHDYIPYDNLDTDERHTFFNEFPSERFTTNPTVSGVMEEGSIDNAYYLFEAGVQDWLILTLEWAPRDDVLVWANSIYEEYSHCKVIVVTHGYLYKDFTRYDWATKGASQLYAPGDVGNDGEQIWQKLVKKHQNSFMVICGHVIDDQQDYVSGLLVSQTDYGNPVYQMVVNYQQRPMGGEALLRILEFLPDGHTIQVKTYSPLNEEYLTEPDHQFVINIPDQYWNCFDVGNLETMAMYWLACNSLDCP